MGGTPSNLQIATRNICFTNTTTQTSLLLTVPNEVSTHFLPLPMTLDRLDVILSIVTTCKTAYQKYSPFLKKHDIQRLTKEVVGYWYHVVGLSEYFFKIGMESSCHYEYGLEEFYEKKSGNWSVKIHRETSGNNFEDTITHRSVQDLQFRNISKILQREDAKIIKEYLLIFSTEHFSTIIDKESYQLKFTKMDYDKWSEQKAAAAVLQRIRRLVEEVCKGNFLPLRCCVDDHMKERTVLEIAKKCEQNAMTEEEVKLLIVAKLNR